MTLHAKTIIGLFLVTLGQLFWNEWLYGELCCSGGKPPAIIYRTFSLIGLFIAFSVFAAFWFAFFKGTL